MDYITIILLLFIILKQFTMSEDLNQIKDDLLAANQTITTAAETAVKIDALPVNPDAAAIQEIKDLASTLRANTASLKDALVATDEKTPEEEVVPPAE